MTTTQITVELKNIAMFCKVGAVTAPPIKKNTIKHNHQCHVTMQWSLFIQNAFIGIPEDGRAD